MARYGREQRGRAVDLYVRYERCAADVIRELGHPGKGALLSWYADRLEEERTRGGDAQEEAPDGRGEESRCVCSIESGPCERVESLQMSGRF